MAAGRDGGQETEEEQPSVRNAANATLAVNLAANGQTGGFRTRMEPPEGKSRASG